MEGTMGGEIEGGVVVGLEGRGAGGEEDMGWGGVGFLWGSGGAGNDCLMGVGAAAVVGLEEEAEEEGIEDGGGGIEMVTMGGKRRGDGG
jgi:hypothetical protein